MDPRAVATGVGSGLVYLGVLVLPPFDGLRWAGVPLVLATGLVAGVAAGLVGSDGPAGAGPDGLISGVGAGSVFAVGFWLALDPTSPPGSPTGVFYGLNHLLATTAGGTLVGEYDRLVVAGLALGGGLVIAALGLYAGRAARRRAGGGLLEW